MSETKLKNGDTGEAALLREWNNLAGRGCWDPTQMRPLRDVVKDANAKGELIHIGSMLPLLYLKGSELDEAKQQLKGRVVFLGDRVRDQYGAAAVFEELASSPAGMEASRFVDAYGLMVGEDGEEHDIEQADAEQAYTQAVLDAAWPTWVRVPKHMRDPS